MTAAIVKALMTADPGRTMFMFPVGDMVAERATPGGLPFDAAGVGAYVTIMDGMLDWITKHRVFDVSSIWSDVWTSLPDHGSIGFGWHPDQGGVSLPSYSVDLPFASPPRIGIDGLYVLSDVAAVIVGALEHDPDGHSITYLALDPSGDIAVNGGTVVFADGGRWQCQVHHQPINPSAVRVMDRMGPDRWKDAVEAYEVPLADGTTFDYCDYIAHEFLRACTVLMINTLVQADPTVMQTTVTPKPLVKANAKRGKRTPRAKSWLDLKGVKYNKRTGSWSGTRTSTGVSWHQVRGHWRHLKSDRYTHKQGQRVWIKPHTQGTLHVPQPGYRADKSLLGKMDPAK